MGRSVAKTLGCGRPQSVAFRLRLCDPAGAGADGERGAGAGSLPPALARRAGRSGAGWFEGLAQRNRYALLARQALWEQLAEYICSLDEEQFRRALVFLRRAFGPFSAREKRQIAENLGECWKLNADVASEMIEQALTEKEEETLHGLNEFDFGDL